MIELKVADSVGALRNVVLDHVLCLIIDKRELSVGLLLELSLLLRTNLSLSFIKMPLILFTYCFLDACCESVCINACPVDVCDVFFFTFHSLDLSTTGFTTAHCPAKAIAVASLDPGIVPLHSSSVVMSVGSLSLSELESSDRTVRDGVGV